MRRSLVLFGVFGLGVMAVWAQAAQQPAPALGDVPASKEDIQHLFEVMQIHPERPFLQAEVFYLRDDPGTAAPEETSRAMELHGEIMKLAGSEPESVADVNAQELSFHLAGSLPLDLDFKQTLLGMKSEPERLRAVISFFENILPNVRRTLLMRRKAGGNGHAS